MNIFGDSEIYLCDIPFESVKERNIMKNLTDLLPFSSGVFLIGGFQHGESEFDRANLNQDLVILTIYNEVKPAWVIVAKIIQWLEAHY